MTRLGALLLLVVLPAVTATAQSARLRIAVLPSAAVGDAKPDQADWLEGKLLRELAKHRAALVRGPEVAKALAKTGKDAHSCDAECMKAIGAQLKVDRVVAPWLALQHRFTKEGTSWVWHLSQFDVKTGKPWGEFEKLCLCPERFWDDIASHQVDALVSYDPATELRLPASAPKAAVSKGPRDEPGMAFIPAGPFIMGTERGEWNDEAPRHLVELSAYYIDKTEVTNAAYTKCVGARKCRGAQYGRDPVLGRPDHPIAAANWFDAVAYCEFVGKRLPTEAEWEKAARGTDEREYPWGNDWDRKKLNHKGDDDGFEKSAPVGSFPASASPYGVLDMGGNLWEWTADNYSQVYFRKSAAKDPKGPPAGRKRAMRGGSWMYDLPFFHTAHNRSPGRPEVHKRYVGFRCAKSL